HCHVQCRGNPGGFVETQTEGAAEVWQSDADQTGIQRGDSRAEKYSQNADVWLSSQSRSIGLRWWSCGRGRGRSHVGFSVNDPCHLRATLQLRTIRDGVAIRLPGRNREQSSRESAERSW